MNRQMCLCSTVLVFCSTALAGITGDLRTWHRVTLTVNGPQASEDGSPNPFLDYRMDVTFTHAKSHKEHVVPGFFAADGNAAETSATAGNQWRAHFTPDQDGDWTYLVSFRAGPDVAIAAETNAGKAVAPNGTKGSFRVRGGTRAKGTLRYVGKHHLQFVGSGEYFLKGGADSPENFLAYEEFDDTLDADADSGSYKKVGPFIHKYEPHVRDWKKGDPSWKGGKGKGIVGALNYLASKGVNSVYFMTYNLDGGDGRDTWMWTKPDVRDRYDVSKLEQWEIVFSHMTAHGMMLHVVTQETENDRKLGGGPGLNPMRALYYRELVARFAHHPAVMWNLGEENNTPDADRKVIAAYIRSVDPYDHPITVHTHNNRALTFYNGLFGDPSFEATSVQGDMKNYNREAVELRRRSAEAGRKWAIFGDEQSPANKGIVPDADDPSHDIPRTQALWGNLMGGGSGVEWYFGSNYAHMDINCEDFRSREKMWDQTRYALEFFRRYVPFWEAEPANDRVSAGNLALAKGDDVLVVYLPAGKSAEVRLGGRRYSVQWYNPRSGGALQGGSVKTVEGPGMQNLGEPPAEADKDWAVLLKAQ